MPAHSHVEPAEGLSKHRIEALTDGIFAMAMTLLVLDLKFPKLPEASANSDPVCGDHPLLYRSAHSA